MSSGFAEMFYYHLLYAALTDSSNNFVYRLTFYEQDESRNGIDIETFCNRGVFINIYLSKDHFIHVFIRKILYNWVHDSTGSAPFCPKVNQNWATTSYHQVKVVFVKSQRL